MTVIGHTGTSKGCTPEQLSSLVDFICREKPSAWHHGDCIGADEQGHWLVRAVMGWKIMIHVHPGNNTGARAFVHHLDDGSMIFVHQMKPNLERNRVIAKAVDLLVATPKEMEEVRRSGTWATVRYALQEKKLVCIILPDGSFRIRTA